MMFLPALKSHPQADLVAICGRNQGRARELANKYQVPLVFADYQQMIDAAIESNQKRTAIPIAPVP